MLSPAGDKTPPTKKFWSNCEDGYTKLGELRQTIGGVLKSLQGLALTVVTKLVTFYATSRTEWCWQVYDDHRHYFVVW